jgi:alkylated DNA repair protein alkB family protein 1
LGNSVYELKRNPGLLILPQALSIQQQMNWAIQAVRSFPLAPYSNLTNLGQNASDLWSLCSENDFSAFKKLRWVNLGYSYDWTLRQYKISEEISSRIPQEISSRLSKIAIDCKTCDSFNAETAIINYYYLDSSMGPHVDDAEFDLSRPVISASLGASAVFLIGGTSKDIEPTSLLVHSGDVVILSGKSRDCFHAVPRILPCSNSKFEEFKHVINDIEDIHDPMEKEKMLKFLCQTRINMNIRQIFSKQN